MRIRAIATTTALAAAGLLAPFATPAQALTTTSTIVAYTADTNDNGKWELYTRPADGSGSPTRLYSPNHVWVPSLSPDGTKVAYLDFLDDTSRLMVRSVDPAGPVTQLSAGDVTASVGWSPDGTKIVYSMIDWDNFEWGTYIVNADGSGAPVLVPTTDEDFGDEPSFSPSGRQVAVDAFNDEGDYVGIDLVTLATGTRARLAGTAGASDAVWSPDGQHILYQKEEGCAVALYRIPSGGGTPTLVRKVANRFLGSAEYSRDGSQLFWNENNLSCATSGDGQLWAGNADGTSAAKVVAMPFDVSGISVAGGVAPADTTAPAAPAINAAGSVGPTTARISWTAGGDSTEFVVVRKAHGDPAPTSPADGTVVYHGAARAVTSTGLVTGTAYDFYVFAYDSSGNLSPVSAVHSSRPTAVPAMKAIARVGSAYATTQFPVAWTATAPTYEVAVGEKVKSASGTWSSSPVWKPYVSGTAETATSFTGGQARTYYFRARGVDEFGNVTAWSATPSKANVPIDDMWSGFTYSAGWVEKTGGSHYVGTYHATVSGGRTMSGTAATSSFVVFGDKCATCGEFKVYVDGVYRRTVDTYASTTKVRQVLYVGGDLGAIKPHSIKIVTVGTSGRPRVNLDAIGLTR